MDMDIITNSFCNRVNERSLKNNLHKGNIKQTLPLKQDTFFSGLNKPYNMSKAKSSKDIPEDANIFLFNCDNKLSIPPDREIKECILTDKGFGFWKRLADGEDGNIMKLKNNNIEYAHGDLTENHRTFGVIEVDNSNVKQIEGVTMLRLKNNSRVGYINQIDEMDAFDSTIGDATVKNAIHLNGNCSANNLKAFTVIAYPGDKIDKISSNMLGCKSDENKPNEYVIVNEANVEEGTELSQVKINKLKTKDLMMNNAVAKDIDAAYGLQIENAAVDHLKLARVVNLTNCKLKTFDLLDAASGVKFNNKIQIDEFNIYDDVAKLFFFPKDEWGNKTNNYIKKINVTEQEGCIYGDPKLKIQGDIDIGTIEFKYRPGVLELTRNYDPNKHIEVINGSVKYNAPKDKPPEEDDIEN